MITDEELQKRANAHARRAEQELGTNCADCADDVIIAIARAFVIGFASGVEAATEDLRRTVKRPR